jgi:hypothetical protein
VVRDRGSVRVRGRDRDWTLVIFHRFPLSVPALLNRSSISSVVLPHVYSDSPLDGAMRVVEILKILVRSNYGGHARNIETKTMVYG